ncbi:hypothetical protein P20652_2789 [Pseudoalteromonas sp. BSi20652]|uniref:globin n=1 Tax=Pseudoalteromonas sp. BSi20652 TaxID=388384 RepID=UPI000231BACB|nr:globin [Pseudoalteromonas sp. BSi20652]GAA60921.1 hypothetical protein P20652_2789 [Pseudoalteromonas sp. BSi20652]
MNPHQPILLKSLSIIKPNFHAFTARFHNKLAESNIIMEPLSAAQFNEKSYTLYCILERIIKNIDNPSSVAPFLAHHLQFLTKRNVHQADIKILCDAFYSTLEEHLGRLFNKERQNAWLDVLKFFENFANNKLFNISNVISFEQRVNQKRLGDV